MLGKLAGWAKQVGKSTFHLRRLNIGPRLTLGFLFIILALLAGNAISFWQFHLARTQAERLSGVDQELIAVLQAHTNLMSFYERLDVLAHSENTGQLVREVEALRNAILQDSRRSRDALSRLPPEVQLDPALLPTLLSIQDSLPAELEAITALAKSNEWEAVRLRLANQVRPLESRSSGLVENIDREVGEVRAQAVLNIGQAQRRILLILPITAVLTLLFAAFLGSAITRSITQPLGRLMEGSTAWARGDFSHRVPAAGKDEIARLGSVFNDMIVRLQELYRELQRREAYLAEAQKLSHTGSFGWDVASGEINWSRETFRIFEYEPTAKATIDLVVQRVHPEDKSAVQQLIERVSRERTEFDFEHRLLMPNGSVKHLRVVGRPSEERGGSFEFVGAVTDVTAAKQVEETLRRSEAYLAEAQRLSHTGSWAGAPGPGEIRYWSEECYRVLGFDPHKELPRHETFFQRIHPDDQARTTEELERASREKTEFKFDYRIVHPGGEIRDIHTVGHPVFSPSGDLVEFVGTVIDVTERKRAEALRDGESSILEMIARDAPLEEILEKLVRVVEAQFAGLLCSVLLLDEDGQHVRHGAAPSLPKAYTEAIDGLSIGPKAGSCGTAMYRRESVVVTDILQDPLWESYRDVAEPYGFRACWSTPILAHSGKALGSFAMYYREPRSPSLAETHALEMATHLAGIAIERKLAREERERLRQAQADLAHINRVTTMGELTASLAHEIKQPIAAAVTNANACLRWLSRDHPDVEEARAAASRLVKDATRAADIISRISLLFKKGAQQRELVDVNELIREMIVLLRGEANRYSIAIRTDLAEDLPKVMADRVQLQQVFMNLMLNGIDAMKGTTGGGELTIKSQSCDAQLLISVRDTGMGLPAEQADHIFKAFFTTKDNGTGMGLPISRSIIESHGGRLWVADSSGRGATFQFTLPATLAAHA